MIAEAYKILQGLAPVSQRLAECAGDAEFFRVANERLDGRLKALGFRDDMPVAELVAAIGLAHDLYRDKAAFAMRLISTLGTEQLIFNRAADDLDRACKILTSCQTSSST